MRPDRVVVASPALDDDLGLAQRVEDLAVEQLIAKAGVEALDVAVLPRTASLDVSGLGADSCEHGAGRARLGGWATGHGCYGLRLLRLVFGFLAVPNGPWHLGCDAPALAQFAPSRCRDHALLPSRDGKFVARVRRVALYWTRAI